MHHNFEEDAMQPGHGRDKNVGLYQNNKKWA
jgi:hypothetical protein